MKRFKIFLLTCVCVFVAQSLLAQTKNYDAQWKKVNELIEQKNLPKSALAEVMKIYAQAKKDKQDAQMVKSLVFMTSLQQLTTEDNEVRAIAEIEKEIATAKEPAASILKNYVAGLYWQYFQRYRWQLYNRTATVNFSKKDIATWSVMDFHQRISELYLASLQRSSLLQQTSLAAYEAIITKGNARHLRPTLYDLLAHNALNYFKNNERDIKRPAYAFEINDPKAFAPAAEFAAAAFRTKDSLSLQHKAILIYQELIRLHLKDARPDALIDVDIDRLEFVKQNAVLEEEDALYEKALTHLIQRWKGQPAAAQASYLLAMHWHQLAATYYPGKDTSQRFARMRAKEILEIVVQDSATKSEGWTNSYNLLQEISRKEFSFEVEKVNVPGQPFRALINYKAVASLQLRLIKATEEIKNLQRQGLDEKYWAELLKAPTVRNWKQELPATNDLQQHRVEIKIDALPVGEYILVAHANSNADGQKENMGAQLFHVSDISYINQGEQFFVLHRESGQPLVNANVDVFARQYDYNSRQYTKSKLATHKTDKNGFFKLEGKKDRTERGYFLDITHGNDHLFLDEQLYNYRYYTEQREAPKPEEKIFFFTDRALYRPGQKVYFKGIVISSHAATNEIIPGYKGTIYLRDANYQLTDSMTVTANEFGSFSGSFQLPSAVLNGSFTITDKINRNQAGFSVEEYKRPKFFLAYDKIKDSYQAGDTIKVTGKATGYAGNHVNGATVNYRVVRQPRFIYPWLWRGWLPQAEPMEIAHGTTVTDAEGKFALSFVAIPDKKIDIKFDPVFDYRIYADVTDQSGETRSAENIVSAGYKSLLLKTNIAERLPVDSFRLIEVRTENMNGEFQPSQIKITLSKLLPEDRLIRKRYWQQPDQFVMSKEEFIKLFPHDEYHNESDFRNWRTGEKVLELADSTRANGKLELKNEKIAAGFYLVEISTKDKNGKEVKDLRYVELFDLKTNKLQRPEYLWTKQSEAIEPGEKTEVLIGTSTDNVFLVKQIEKPTSDRQSTTEVTTLNNERKRFEFTATEEDRGGYGASFFFVKHNRFYQFNDVIAVPWSNKELQIEFSSFRDKTLPGSEEKWTVKIKGYKNEKVAAEMLASMYDASLDQFKMHAWSKPAIWSVFARLFNWQSGQNFSAVTGYARWQPVSYRSFEKNYDQLIFGTNNSRNVYLERRPGRAAGIEVMAKPTDAVANARREKNEVAPQADGLQEQFATDTTTVSKQDDGIQIRKNLQETAFFFPELRTDKDGNIEFTFTAPEALTKWKLQTLSHTKNLAFGYAQKELTTQKELMVQPNAPRFLRQGDRLEFSANIVNLSDRELTGQAGLQLFDASTNQPVDGWFLNSFPNQYFTVAAGQTEVVKFPMEVPHQFSSTLVWRVVARADNFSDGEENILPVLSNKMLVTKTLPLPMRGNATKDFRFEKLINTTSETLQHQALTVEYMTNPVWLAVQALPYLMETTHESADQTWNRVYANSLASSLVQSMPKLKQIFATWKTFDTSALLSNLQKNQELKSVLLEETPWVLQAKSEEQQKKNIALLFDLTRMSTELKNDLAKLKTMQSENGGFVWFKGGPDDRYMTQYIITGIGHLQKLNDIPQEAAQYLSAIVNKALPYLDQRVKEDYDKLIKSKADLKKQVPDQLKVQYLYMRSFFTDKKITKGTETAYNFYRSQLISQWMKTSPYMQGMAALALHRTGDKQTPRSILASLKETAIVNEEMGMYWKDQRFGFSWFWWAAPIETQSLMIEVFEEISADKKTVDDLRTWLLKHKQTNNWRTTKATADAVYALLLEGTNWLNAEPTVQIQLGKTTVSSTTQPTEAGTGYFKKTIEGNMVKPEMGNIHVKIQTPGAPNNLPSWGAVYWQYFEEMDKISSAATPLQLNKKLFVETNTDRGPVLTPVDANNVLKVGDKVKVRIELRVDRDMEYVHMKDLRASALEPANVLSGYKWQGGLGYYETTKDASTHFFFNYLRKGTYVFEYPLFVTHTGNFTNGITSIQCLYAPEFAAHSEGVRIAVE